MASPEIVEQFMFELFSTPRYCQWKIHVHLFAVHREWNIEGKSYDRGNVKAYNAFGTTRINGYKIMEETLNLKDVRIFDYIEDENGKKTAVLNKKETLSRRASRSLSSKRLRTGYGVIRSVENSLPRCITKSSTPPGRVNTTAAT